ncbi:MAG TPA: phage holin family protein [Candidatus Paceibacterota bacterium]
MRLVFLFLTNVASNIVAFLLANRYITGFSISEAPYDLIFAAVVLALLNYLVRPILKLVLGPAIILTLGLGIILVNALILYILTQFPTGVTIQGTLALLYATLLISAVSLVLNLIAKRIA